MNIDTIIETVKKLEKSGNDISIIVKNIKTKGEGVATILPNYSIIKLENELGEEFE